MNRAVFLDRDGVINRSFVIDGRPIAPRSFAEFRLLPGAGRSIATLKRRGFKIVVVTNQPDIAKGRIDASELARMNGRLTAELEVDLVEVCHHAQDAGCRCRKPAAGMLRAAARKLALSLPGSYMVGDRWSDVAAGATAGCYTIKIERGYSNEQPSQPDAVVGSLAAAARHILTLEKTHARP